jgi:hypothetical protein
MGFQVIAHPAPFVNAYANQGGTFLSTATFAVTAGGPLGPGIDSRLDRTVMDFVARWMRTHPSGG